MLILLILGIVFSFYAFVIKENRVKAKPSKERIKSLEERKNDVETKDCRTNVLVLKERLECNKAFFKDYTVYAITNYGDYVIGYFDDQGNVYSTGEKKIAEITLTAEFEGRIQLLRIDEFEELRSLHKDEWFNTLLNRTIPLWMCAEVDWHGRVLDFETGETIATRDIYTENYEKNTIGYGPCFACLQYQTGAHGKYADFYTCPIGARYEYI